MALVLWVLFQRCVAFTISLMLVGAITGRVEDATIQHGSACGRLMF